ncbi:CBS domain-containing protein [Actinoallomurus spadix]|uniref:CBS domain-containing protein n=1 Tax=Actinoallomurus spadix TaxID=79912 RepID=A0ABN0VWS9_9ACTN|nr:CBS domain-containing protein [Actinoallomurus spadix]MCO5985894.1 CBS domain-containing protein [Actinoallomurus spadix]
MRTEVRDVMATDVVSVGEQTTFKEIVEVMYRDGVRALPVLDSTGQVRGVVSTSDLLCKEADPAATEDFHVLPAHRRAQRKAEAVTAAELMTVPPVTVSPATTVQEAARTMRRHDVNQLPVTDGLTGRLVGIVSRADLLGVYTRPDADIQGDILTEVIADRFRLDPGRFDVIVDRGRVAVQGTVERRSSIATLLHAVRRVEGVVSVTSRLEYRLDDLYPVVAP